MGARDREIRPPPKCHRDRTPPSGGRGPGPRHPWGGNEKFQQNDPRASLGAIAGLLDRGGNVFSTRTADRLRLLRYATFNVAMGNTDAHAKNFSLLHDEAGAMFLAPPLRRGPARPRVRGHDPSLHVDRWRATAS
ncbi:HipA domain-containing protein [Microbacterium enclense]|uniref:HipA domain-containing protein n=1 Tax=Microbacterium enclense TaxID=993073 RepID=UPI003D16073B